MMRRVTIYKYNKHGFECLRTFIEVDNDNLVEETEDTITVNEPSGDMWGSIIEVEQTYFKTPEAFLKNEKEKYLRAVQNLIEKHELTTKMANKWIRTKTSVEKDLSDLGC
jgi:hypothetical protein